MTRIIQTKRLTIRPLSTSDYESWYQGFSDRLPAQHPFDDGLLDMSICTREWFEDLVEKHQRMWATDDTYIFALFDQEQRHIGMVNLATLARSNLSWGELGYFIHNHYWRQGFAYEALSAILIYAKDDLDFHRIEAHVSLENHPSQKLLRKLQFHHEGIRKQFMYEFGKWSDKDIFYLNLHDEPQQ